MCSVASLFLTRLSVCSMYTPLCVSPCMSVDESVCVCVLVSWHASCFCCPSPGGVLFTFYPIFLLLCQSCAHTDCCDWLIRAVVEGWKGGSALSHNKGNKSSRGVERHRYPVSDLHIQARSQIINAFFLCVLMCDSTTIKKSKGIWTITHQLLILQLRSLCRQCQRWRGVIVECCQYEHIITTAQHDWRRWWVDMVLQ